MIRIRFDIWSRLFIDSVKEYLSVSKVAMRLKVISYLSFWSRSKNKNMLWPFWSKDWGPEFSIAQPKVTAYLKSNHILSFITCSSDPSPNPKSTDSDMFHKICCLFWSAQSEFLFEDKKTDQTMRMQLIISYRKS